MSDATMNLLLPQPPEAVVKPLDSYAVADVFTPGDRVEVRDTSDDEWKEGVVTEIEAGAFVRVQPDGFDFGFRWKYCRPGKIPSSEDGKQDIFALTERDGKAVATEIENASKKTVTTLMKYSEDGAKTESLASADSPEIGGKTSPQEPQDVDIAIRSPYLHSADRDHGKKLSEEEQGPEFTIRSPRSRTPIKRRRNPRPLDETVRPCRSEQMEHPKIKKGASRSPLRRDAKINRRHRVRPRHRNYSESSSRSGNESSSTYTGSSRSRSRRKTATNRRAGSKPYVAGTVVAEQGKSEFIALVDRTKSNKLGIHVKDGGDSLIVKEIREGAVMNWNIDHPTTPIRPNDRIISVNGCAKDSAEILRRVSEVKVLHMKVERRPPQVLS